MSGVREQLEHITWLGSPPRELTQDNEGERFVIASDDSNVD